MRIDVMDGGYIITLPNGKKRVFSTEEKKKLADWIKEHLPLTEVEKAVIKE